MQRTATQQDAVAVELSKELTLGDQGSATDSAESSCEHEEINNDTDIQVGTALGFWWDSCPKQEKNMKFSCTVVAFGTDYLGASDLDSDSRWEFVIDDDPEQDRWGISMSAVQAYRV